MNHIQVGMVPLAHSHSSGLLWKNPLQEERYDTKSQYVSVDDLR